MVQIQGFAKGVKFKRLISTSTHEHPTKIFHDHSENEGGYGVSLSKLTFAFKKAFTGTINSDSVASSGNIFHNKIDKMGREVESFKEIMKELPLNGVVGLPQV